MGGPCCLHSFPRQLLCESVPLGFQSSPVAPSPHQPLLPGPAAWKADRRREGERSRSTGSLHAPPLPPGADTNAALRGQVTRWEPMHGKCTGQPASRCTGGRERLQTRVLHQNLKKKKNTEVKTKPPQFLNCPIHSFFLSSLSALGSKGWRSPRHTENIAASSCISPEYPAGWKTAWLKNRLGESSD